MTKETEILVFIVRRDAQCAECGKELHKGSLLRTEGGKALCLSCADLDHLEYLPSGDAAVTRRATRYSRLRAVVLKWSRGGERYERQGILADREAIERAVEESAADADIRAQRQEREAVRRTALDQAFVADFAEAVRRQFPGCPPGQETLIAEHACLKYSGRVGRSAAAKNLDPHAVRLAVTAHIRHRFTRYDELLSEFGDRDIARREIHDELEDILAQWEKGEPIGQEPPR